MGYRKRGDSYEVNVAYKGARKFATVGTEPEAKDKEVELKAQLIQEWRQKNGESAAPQPVTQAAPVVPTTWTLGEAFDKTFEVHWNGTKSEAFYKTKQKVVEAYFGRDKRLGDINTDAVDGFKKALLKKGNSQATINHALVALSMVFKIAHQRGGVPFKPVLGIKKSTRGRVRYLNDEKNEEGIILRLLTQRGKADMVDWTIVMLDTGMRPSETKKMTGQWVDFRNNTVNVLESKTKAGIRSIPMTKRVRAILERRCLAFPKGYLFPYQWQRYGDAWEQVRAAMGLEDDQDFVPYCLRHTFGTRLAQRGVPINTIKDLMGHETITQTMVYAKLGAKQFVEAMRVLEPERDTVSSQQTLPHATPMPQVATNLPQKAPALATPEAPERQAS